jgi:hypothetical protein
MMSVKKTAVDAYAQDLPSGRREAIAGSHEMFHQAAAGIPAGSGSRNGMLQPLIFRCFWPPANVDKNRCITVC